MIRKEDEKRLSASEIPFMRTMGTQYYIINKMETLQKNYQFRVNYQMYTTENNMYEQ
jgi:hypothetical protein